MNLKRFLLFVWFVCLISLQLNAAKQITIHTDPENATISIDGAEVGVGTYTVKFNKKTDFYVVKVSAPGYLSKTFRLLKSNPSNTVLYKLPEDEAMQNSRIGSDLGADMANKWFDVVCASRLDENEIWKRLIATSLNYFDNIEIRDKEAGWIRTGWKTTTFTNQIVRTQMEIRVQFIDGETDSYKVRIISEIRDKNSSGPQSFVKYDRVLNHFIPLVQELQVSVGR